jgi:cytochrome c oxidase subunit 2
LNALTLDPAGSQAAPVATLTWILIWGAVAIFALVLALLIVAVTGPETWRRRLRSQKLVLAGGMAFPVVVLTSLLVVGLTLTAHLGRIADDALVIRVTGYRWWWAVDYPGFTTANEVVLPVGRPVVLELATGDVIHSFWVPQLGGKRDMIPGKVNRITMEAGRPGDYFGICAEYCGGPHALMQLRLRALPEAEWQDWARLQRRAAAAPANPLARRGGELFQSIGCGSCHRVAGTRANGAGSAGPDLSHVASRTTLGAGIIPNDRAHLIAWTADPHQFKQGVGMPAFGHLPHADLEAIAAYMEALR